MLIEKTLAVSHFQSNCNIVACPQTGDAVIIDPGGDSAKILATLKEMQTRDGRPIRVRYLLHTHAHIDHAGATRSVREALERTQGEAPLIYMHQGDEPIYQMIKKQAALFSLSADEPCPVDHYLLDGENIKVGQLNFEAIHTPGHSPGGTTFKLHADTNLGVRETLYTGDTIFLESIGRTDLWGGSYEQLLESIKQKILPLNKDTRICPGHGPDTTVGHEKHNNPFLK